MFKKLKEKLRAFDDFQKQGLIDLACDYGNEDKDNMLNCSKCGSKLGLWKMVYHARKVQRGDYYKIRCKNCKHVNKIKMSLKDGNSNR